MPTSIDAKKVIAEAAREHGVLLEEGDPLFVALAAHVVVLQEVGDRLLREVEDVSNGLRSTVPAEIESALRSAVETAAESVRRGLDSDIESARSLSEKYLSRPHVVMPEHFDHKMLWPNWAIFE